MSAIAQIEERYQQACDDYATTVVPGVTDDSVLEAERDTLEWVLGTLKAAEPSEDALPVLAFSPEAHDTWIGVVNGFRGYGVTITLADGEEVEAVLVGQEWDEGAADYRIAFYRAADSNDYPAVDDIPAARLETAVGVKRIHVS